MLTDGQVVVTIFPHGTLGGDVQAADSVQMGIAQNGANRNICWTC